MTDEETIEVLDDMKIKIAIPKSAITQRKRNEALDMAIKALEQTRWIPVSERLPEEYDRVLCATNAEEIFIANYLGKMNDGVDCFDDDDGMMWEGDVVAWMPLPEPYKAESED